MFYSHELQQATSFFSFLGYTKTTNTIISSRSIDDNYVTYASFENYGSKESFRGRLNLSKKINNTTMMVVVYSPFVYYYEGLWYKSGWLLVPFTAFDYRITPKFKLNLSFSGVQQIKSTTINYQVLLGAKALL